jgi:hypothetical protein
MSRKMSIGRHRKKLRSYGKGHRLGHSAAWLSVGLSDYNTIERGRSGDDLRYMCTDWQVATISDLHLQYCSNGNIARWRKSAQQSCRFGRNHDQ